MISIAEVRASENAMAAGPSSSAAAIETVRQGLPGVPLAQTSLRLLAVWTRELDGGERVGRVNVARKIRDELERLARVTNRRLTNAFEDSQPIRALVAAAMALLIGLLSGRPLPLQCALFAASSRRSALLAESMAVDVVYLDGIRTLLLMRRLRRSAPRLRIVVDLDDLMSRRYEQLGRRGLPFPLGYIERMMPRSLSRVAMAKIISRAIFWYESLALRRAENEILRLADSIVLLNSTEAASLRARGPRRGDNRPQAAVVAIPPAVKPLHSVVEPFFPPTAKHWRAIFVGSDMLVQNRLTIAYLLKLWSTFEIQTPLRIIGRQQGHWPATPNVTFCGYIPNIADVYEPGNFLIYPCLLPGGIKTKVLEAFAYGVPVLGNTSTFEDILPIGYPLVVDDEAKLVGILKEPGGSADIFAQAATLASDYLAKEHSETSFAAQWRQVVFGADKWQPGRGTQRCD